MRSQDVETGNNNSNFNNNNNNYNNQGHENNQNNNFNNQGRDSNLNTNYNNQGRDSNQNTNYNNKGNQNTNYNNQGRDGNQNNNQNNQNNNHNSYNDRYAKTAKPGSMNNNQTDYNQDGGRFVQTQKPFEGGRFNQSSNQEGFSTNLQYGDQTGMGGKMDEQGDPRLIYADSLYLSFSGVIEAGECDDEDSLRVEYSIKYSKDDWVYLNRSTGDMEPAGISQLSTSHNLHTKNIVWNFPFECNFKTNNPFGWPQVVVRISGPDFMGRSVLKGYGSIHVPTTAGYHERTIHVYKPLPQSWFTGMLGYLLGNTAELKNFDRVISSGEGREVTRVRSVGYVKIKFHVTLVNFEKFGYM